MMASEKSPGGQVAEFGPNGTVTIKSVVRTGQIITFALAKGLVLIAIAAILLSGKQGEPANGPGDRGDQQGVMADSGAILPIVGFAAFVLAAVAGFVVPGFIRASAIHDFQQSGQRLPSTIDVDAPLTQEAGQLMSRLMVSTLIGQAIFEGAGMLNLVLLMLTNQWYLLIPAIFAVFAIVAQCPSQANVLDRLERLARG
jgi:hypothetical protein